MPVILKDAPLQTCYLSKVDQVAEAVAEIFGFLKRKAKLLGCVRIDSRERRNPDYHPGVWC